MKNYPITPIELELRKIGLGEKEARVYLILLELGNIPVQEIALKVSLSRPTVYRVLDSLQDKKLITRERKNKIRYVAAHSPDELLGILRTNKKKIEEQERELLRIISILQTKYYSDGENEIKTYSGKEGKKLLLDDFLNTSSKQILIIHSSNESISNSGLETLYKKIRKRLGKIDIKELSHQMPSKSASKVERRHIPNLSETFPETLIILDRVIILKKSKGFVIEHEDIIDSMRNLFNLIWKSA